MHILDQTNETEVHTKNQLPWYTESHLTLVRVVIVTFCYLRKVKFTPEFLNWSLTKQWPASHPWKPPGPIKHYILNVILTLSKAINLLFLNGTYVNDNIMIHVFMFP